MFLHFLACYATTQSEYSALLILFRGSRRLTYLTSAYTGVACS